MPRPSRLPAFTRAHAVVPAPGDTPGPRMTGRITKVVRSRACGFIRMPDGQDVFFHASDLDQIALEDLDEQLIVQFHLVADAISGPRAAHVQVARPAPASRAVWRKTSARTRVVATGRAR
jgi:cold shock CspA family protein